MSDRKLTPPSSPTVPLRAPRNFVTTNWTIVRQAASDDDGTARAALDTLCNAYWYPIYAYIRSRNRKEADAEDLTQGFFHQLLRRNAFAAADPVKGRLRSYLLSSVRHYLTNEHEHATADKRGGEMVITSFDAAWAEGTLAAEPIDELTPDRIYQRSWAMLVLEFAFQVLAEEYASDGKAEEYQMLRPMLGFTTVSESSYEQMAAESGLSVNVLKMRVYRMRERWKEIVRKQVALTLGDASEQNIKDELSELLGMV